MSEIDHLDFNFYPRCENLNEPCMDYAAWRVITACCNNVLLICKECKYWADRLHKAEEEEGYTAACNFCGEELPPTKHFKSVQPLT